MYSSVIFYPHLFCEGSRKQPKYFPRQTPFYSECPMVSSIPATVHLRPQTIQLCLAMPPPNFHLCPAMSPSNCPLPVSQVLTAGATGWRCCHYGEAVCRTNMFQLDYRRISPTQQQSTQQFHTLSR